MSPAIRRSAVRRRVRRYLRAVLTIRPAWWAIVTLLLAALALLVAARLAALQAGLPDPDPQLSGGHFQVTAVPV